MPSRASTGYCQFFHGRTVAVCRPARNGLKSTISGRQSTLLLELGPQYVRFGQLTLSAADGLSMKSCGFGTKRRAFWRSDNCPVGVLS
jgi:hypothetical protein